MFLACTGGKWGRDGTEDLGRREGGEGVRVAFLGDEMDMWHGFRLFIDHMRGLFFELNQVKKSDVLHRTLFSRTTGYSREITSDEKFRQHPAFSAASTILVVAERAADIDGDRTANGVVAALVWRKDVVVPYAVPMRVCRWQLWLPQRYEVELEEHQVDVVSTRCAPRDRVLALLGDVDGAAHLAGHGPQLGCVHLTQRRVHPWQTKKSCLQTG